MGVNGSINRNKIVKRLAGICCGSGKCSGIGRFCCDDRDREAILGWLVLGKECWQGSTTVDEEFCLRIH